MALSRLPDPSRPESVDFDTRRRGFDQMQVRAYLKVLAHELTRLREREADLLAAMAGVDETPRPEPVEFDEQRAMVLLGEETTRVLGAARSAAADIVQRAHHQARDIVDSAEAEAAEIRSSGHLAVDAELAGARHEGRTLIAEAKLVRERMLDDLGAERQVARAQLEQLRAGRDRLGESYAQIRAALDDIGSALDDALPQAQLSARRAAERIDAQALPTAAMIERELADAARAGMPVVAHDEVNAELASAADEAPAAWVNGGARALDTPDRLSEDANAHDATSEDDTPDLFGELDENERAFFGDDIESANAAVAMLDPSVISVSHDIADDAPGEIVLADVTRSRRDVGLPREAVPIVTAPDAVEAVRVLRDDEPATASPSPMPSPRVAEFAPVQAPEPEPLPLPVGDTEPVGELSIDAPDSVVPAAAADDVFSRIRRTREANLARAEEVLSSALFTPRVDEAVEAESAVVAVAMPTPESATMQRSAVVAEDRVGAVVADDTDHFAARESALASVQTQIGRKIKRLLADEQNDVLDLVRRAPGTTVHDEVLPLLGDHVGRYVAAIGGELLIAVGAGASFFGAGVGGDAADLAALDRCVGDELVVPLRVLLQRALSDDPGSDEILDRVRAAYREVKGQRVDEAARTIACASFNAGIEAALVGQQVRWAVDPVRGCSPDCDDNALEGPVDIGTAFPTGATRPPGHLGCRCLLVPAQQ